MKLLLSRRFIAGLPAALVGGVGLFTLLVWVMDLWEVVTMGAGYIPMVPITALLFVFLAADPAGFLWLTGRRSVGWNPLAAVALLLAVAGAGLPRFAVENQGIGIPAEDLKRTFEPFERGSSVGNIKGLGLGMKIVMHMTEMLHGEISVRSGPASSCFTATVPSQPIKTPPS